VIFLFSHFGTVPACDRRTDGQPDGWTHDDSIYRTSTASHHKNTSSTKPEIHNELHCHEMRTEAQPRATGNTYRNYDDMWIVVFEICEWTDRQTHRHADCNTLHL